MPSRIRFIFDEFELDPDQRRLTRAGEPVPVASRSCAVLVQLVSQAGTVISKNALTEVAWGDVAVTDNSVEQAISALRRVLGHAPGGQPYIQNVPRHGYRFTGRVTRVTARTTDDALEAILAPHRAWIEGRAALETLERDEVLRAREAFEGVVRQVPEQAAVHVGLANACVMQFEMTRADADPDVASLARAAEHAREACRLDAGSGEAWATLGFVLDRTGHRQDALAASRQAVSLEPDNWRHFLRLSYIGWGEERLRAAQRVLALLPGFPQAHWLAATVYVARQALDRAERELTAGISEERDRSGGPTRFTAVALHWLLGLIQLDRGDEEGALQAFQRELSLEASGHLYARECCANAWYAIGAVRLRQGAAAEARAAFGEAIRRISRHPMAHVGLASPGARVVHASSPVADKAGARETGIGQAGGTTATDATAGMSSIEAVAARAAALALGGAPEAGATVLEEALASAPAGSAGWWLPVEPILRPGGQPVWASTLARLRARAV